MEKTKLFIATPHNGNFSWQYVLSMNLTWKQLSDKYDIGISLIESPLVHANRNNIMREVSEQECDFLLFIDSDIVWSPEHIEQLIEFDRDVVSGLYLIRKPDDGQEHTPVVYRYNYDHVLKPIYNIPENVFKCDAVGAGFLLLKKTVVNKMVELIPKIGYPFDFISAEEMGIPPKENTNLVGEDICFCYRLKKAGFDIWCDPSCKVGHITSGIIL